jgi:predicted Zn-dependent peptidase
MCSQQGVNAFKRRLWAKFVRYHILYPTTLIPYTYFQLENGLRVIHHQDESTQLCVLNILYDVGSKHEHPNKTGFAHLFEHLMFGGSQHIPQFDTPLQFAGGESNAFTSNDITNYYLTLPAPNIETGFWLESDRMLSLDFSQQSLDIQKNVVIEEYKERYLNPPYGDVWLKLLPLAYTAHPYQWPTIGKDVSHIQDATLDDVKAFFKNFYCPNNAILVIAGNISLEKATALTHKWFAPIPAQNTSKPTYTSEPKQQKPRFAKVEADVPVDLLVRAYHTVPRNDADYYTTDLISDMLGSGKSARLYNALVKENRLFSELDCYLTGDIDAGLIVIEGKLLPGISIETGEKAVEDVLQEFCVKGVEQAELEKVKNKTETNIRFNDIGVLNKAMKLAYCCLLGDINLVNEEVDRYRNITTEDVARVAQQLFDPNNCSTLHYLAKQHA